MQRVKLRNSKNEDASGPQLQPAPALRVGYLERNEPLPLDQPDRKATTFVTSRSAWTISCSPARTRPLSVEGVFQMAYILPERLLALVRPAGVRLQNNDP